MTKMTCETCVNCTGVQPKGPFTAVDYGDGTFALLSQNPDGVFAATFSNTTAYRLVTWLNGLWTERKEPTNDGS